MFVKKCVVFYSKAWRQINGVFYASEICQKFAIERHRQLKEKIERENQPEMRKHVQK